MNEFASFIEDTLHLKTKAFQYDQLDKLPLYLRNDYEISMLGILNTRCLLMSPKDKNNLTVLRKQAKQLMKLTGFNTVICLEVIRKYTKEKMLSEGIPFVILGKQVFMPFLGVALTKQNTRDIPHIEQISFSTQKMILIAIYQNINDETLTKWAKLLGISKMSVSRSFDELQALELNLIRQSGKSRIFGWVGTRREFWNEIYPFMRNPVARQYRLGKVIDKTDFKLGGLTAICHYSMLAEVDCLVYAIDKETEKIVLKNKLDLVPNNEVPVMIIQVMQYMIYYQGGRAIDPLSTVLSLAEDEKGDPRIESAIEQVLEECLNG